MRHPGPTRRRGMYVVAAMVAAMVLAGCSGSGGETTPTQTTEDLGQNRPSTLPPRPTEATTSTSSTAVTTSSAETSVVDTSVPGGDRLTPADLGPLVDPTSVPDAPGMPVPGEVIEISPMVWMYLPSVFSQDDPNVIPPKPEDIEILVGYGRAMGALYTQITQNPVPAEPIPAVQAAFADGGAAVRAESFDQRNAEGTSAGFPDSRPDLYRPSVLTSPRSETMALVADCTITGGGLVYADGTPVNPTSMEPYSAPYGLLAEMVKVDGVWKVATRAVASQAVCR
jgi:hypothetical protein